MPRRIPLPPDLATRAFRVDQGLAAGLGERRMRGADLSRPFRGVRAPLDDSLIASCEAYALLMTDQHHFSHQTAARLWGCPLPTYFDGEPLHVSVAPPGRARRGAGVVGHQSREITTLRHGLRVSDPASTWLALASILPLDELVVCGDHLILEPEVLDPLDLRPYVTLDALRERLAQFSGRGARRAATALALIRDGAESRPETLLRLVLVRAHLPEAELNIDLFDSAGRWLARGDIVFLRWRVVVEYDGEGHRTNSRQYDRDMTRIENLINAGYAVVRVRKSALFSRPETVVARVVRALESHGWRA